jgi:hypothetical protein
MKTTVTILKSCAKDLEEVRAQLPNNLEPSVIVLFDSVVERLKQCDVMENDRVALVALIDDGLQLAGHLGEVALVITQLVKHYHG